MDKKLRNKRKIVDRIARNDRVILMTAEEQRMEKIKVTNKRDGKVKLMSVSTFRDCFKVCEQTLYAMREGAIEENLFYKFELQKERR